MFAESVVFRQLFLPVFPDVYILINKSGLENPLHPVAWVANLKWKKPQNNLVDRKFRAGASLRREVIQLWLPQQGGDVEECSCSVTLGWTNPTSLSPAALTALLPSSPPCLSPPRLCAAEHHSWVLCCPGVGQKVTWHKPNKITQYVLIHSCFFVC